MGDPIVLHCPLLFWPFPCGGALELEADPVGKVATYNSGSHPRHTTDGSHSRHTTDASHVFFVMAQRVVKSGTSWHTTDTEISKIPRTADHRPQEAPGSWLGTANSPIMMIQLLKLDGLALQSSELSRTSLCPDGSVVIDYRLLQPVLGKM
jgi:hypothetical protein